MENTFDYYDDGGGIYIITRNGDFFLSCCGSRSDAEHIVKLLREDAERMRDSRADADD